MKGKTVVTKHAVDRFRKRVLPPEVRDEPEIRVKAMMLEMLQDEMRPMKPKHISRIGLGNTTIKEKTAGKRSYWTTKDLRTIFVVVTTEEGVNIVVTVVYISSHTTPKDIKINNGRLPKSIR